MLSDRDFLAIHGIDIRNNEFKAIPYILLNICTYAIQIAPSLRLMVTFAICRLEYIHQNLNIQQLHEGLQFVAEALPWNNHQEVFLAVWRRYNGPRMKG